MARIDIDSLVREEWRNLQFYYEIDDDARTWRLAGSKKGLRNFSYLLREYVSKPANKLISEHEHYGPYNYLKVMTWTDPEISGNAIVGTLSDIERLAGIVDSHLDIAKSGDIISIANEYVEDAEYDLVLEVHPANTDPVKLEALRDNQ